MSIARRTAVERTLSESFAVVANRKHTLAVRNGTKFRGVFLIFGCETLFSRQTCGTIRQTFGSMVRFWAMTDRMMAQTWYQMTLASTPAERSVKPLMVSCRPNGKPFMAKRQTYVSKHKPHGSHTDSGRALSLLWRCQSAAGQNAVLSAVDLL